MVEKESQHDTEENKCNKKSGCISKKTVQEKKKEQEIEKRKLDLQTLINFERLPLQVSDILKLEEKENGYIFSLGVNEIEIFWKNLLPFVKELVAEECENKSSNEVLNAAINVLQYTSLYSSIADCETFIQIVTTLNLAIVGDRLKCLELKNQICKLSETCCIKELRLPGNFFLNTLKFLFDITLNRKSDNVKLEIKRMWGMRGPISQLNLRTPSCDVIVSKLLSAVVSPSYLSCKEGRQFIAFTLTLDIKLIKKFHQAIKDFLPMCKKNQANAYGEIYYTAWANGSSEVRQALEKECIQNLMSHIMVCSRKTLEFSQLGQNIFAILSYLHHNRMITHFSKILTELYMPILWRHLRSGNNIERCNAAEIFLDIYPLEMPGYGKAEESSFFNKQHNEMVDLLTDNCHVVRIIAIKGICVKLSSAWRTFPQETIQVLMRNLTALANDGSHALVRRTLYESMRVMLQSEDSAIYLSRVLPNLHPYIHDENEKVRCSFVKLLCAVKNMPKPAPIKYWKIVNMEHLAARLEIDGPEVGTALASLLMSNIYTSGLKPENSLLRIIKFIGISPKAARKLFQHSSKVLDYRDAVKVIITILVNLRLYVKRIEASTADIEETQQDKKPSANMSKRKKRRSLQPLQTISENQPNECGESEREESEENVSQRKSLRRASTGSENKSVTEEAYGEPGVAHALLDIVSLLFTLHSQAFTDPNNEEDHNNFMDIACAGIPLFLKHFKGTPTYFGVIHLASLVPAAKLTPVSTVCSACVSHLKQISEMTPQEEIKVIIHALCSWNRFADIQDLVMDWLDQAFRCEGLNQSQALQGNYKQRKVRFVAKGGKPMLALELLDHVFSHPVNSDRIMRKSYTQVYELYIYMERIKILIERRLAGGLPLDSPMLSDEFLVKCFYRYSKLILLLNRGEPFTSRDSDSLINGFDSSEVFYQLIEWSNRIIKPVLPESLDREPDLSVILLRDVVLRTAANMINITLADEKTIIKLAGFIRDLLDLDCGLWFVGMSMNVVKFTKDYTDAYHGPKDNAQLMKLILPSVLSRVLRKLSMAKYSKEQIVECVQNVNEVKSTMYELLITLKKMYGPHSEILRQLLQLFTDCMVASLSHDIKQLQLIETADHVNELPFVCGLLLSIVCRPTLNSLWIATVPSSISALYCKDSNILSAAVSLLHTLSHSSLSLPRKDLNAAVRQAYSAVMSYARDCSSSELSDSVFSSDSIDVKKTAAPLLTDMAEFLNCTLR